MFQTETFMCTTVFTIPIGTCTILLDVGLKNVDSGSGKITMIELRNM